MAKSVPGGLEPIVSEKDGPKAGAEFSRMLRETAATAELKAADFGLLRQRLRELQMEFAKLKWRKTQDDAGFLAHASSYLKQEYDVLLRSTSDLAQTKSEIENTEQAIQELFNELQDVEPTAIRIIVELDMARYSDIAKALQDKSGAREVMKLNRQIKKFVTDAIQSVDTPVKKTLLKTSGDGAILAFAESRQASLFGEILHKIAQAHNRTRRRDLDQRHFRVGIAAGGVILDFPKSDDGEESSVDMAGMAISNAVRLEAACRTGEVLIDAGAWAMLPDREKKLYGSEEIVRGKRKERISAHRRRVVPPAPWDRGKA